MSIVVNGRFLERRTTGVERYGREILSRLEDRSARDGVAGMQVVRYQGRAGGWRAHLWEQVALRGQVGPSQLLWSPANTGPLNVRNQVLSLHDLSPLEHPEWFAPTFALWYRLFLPFLVRRVRRVVTPSHFVRVKVLKRFRLPGERVAVVPGGVDTSVFHPGAASRLSLPACYVLFVGSLQPRKNLARLLAAWDKMKDTVPNTWLLLAGAGGSAFRPAPLPETGRVKFLGAIPDEDLPELYARAALFVLPSLDEGFGLPVLEAMACGTAALVSKTGALPEVVSESAWLFDPVDVDEIAAALERGLRDSALQTSLREKGLAHARCFSWDVSAEMLWKVFEGCL